MITYKELDGIRAAMSKLSDDVRQMIVEVIERVGTGDEDALRDAVLEELAPLMESADAMAAEIAAAVYNGWRFEALGLYTETVTATAYDAGKIAAVANTVAKAARDGSDAASIANIVSSRALYDIRNSYGSTIIENAGRDTAKVRFARIPSRTESYSDGCPFCRMLASRGFVYHSRKKAGEFDHYHPDCSCVVVSVFEDNPKVEGYDPESYYDEYLTFRDKAESDKAETGDYTAVDARDIAKAARDIGMDGRA